MCILMSLFKCTYHDSVGSVRQKEKPFLLPLQIKFAAMLVLHATALSLKYRAPALHLTAFQIVPGVLLI